jgi:hypothetical protein
MKYNIALLHYSCPPVVGGVEEMGDLFEHFRPKSSRRGFGKDAFP